MDRYGESQATIDGLILEELSGRQASNVRVHRIQTYTYLVSTNQKANRSVEASRRLYMVCTPRHTLELRRSSQGQPYASLAEACHDAVDESDIWWQEIS